jgi:ABC-type sugar transport system substrate-binding protein
VTSNDPHRTWTLRDVSEACGVSEMTVSRVLRNRGDVSEATRAKVIEAARRLGSVPNKIAGALASQRVNLVGVIIPSLSNMVFPEVLSGISETLDDTGLQPVVGVTNYSPEREEAVLFEMLAWRPSGVILAGLEHSDASRAMLARAGVPLVVLFVHGSSFCLDPGFVANADAILDAWYPGMRGGAAMADAVVGAFSPAGIIQLKSATASPSALSSGSAATFAITTHALTTTSSCWSRGNVL